MILFVFWTAVEKFSCNFEDAGCVGLLTNDTNQKDVWTRMQARSQPVLRDNTLDLGRFMSVVVRDVTHHTGES